MKLNKRWAVLITLLALSAGLVLFSAPPKREAEVVTPTARTTRATAATTARTESTPVESDAGMILPIRPRARGTALADAFALQNWTPPPPPPPPAQPPPKPTAPALPFTVLGKKLEDGGWQVFLGRQDRTYIVRAQDVIEGNYRVESIAPPNLVFTYIPLNERQTLAIGDAN